MIMLLDWPVGWVPASRGLDGSDNIRSPGPDSVRQAKYLHTFTLSWFTCSVLHLAASCCRTFRDARMSGCLVRDTSHV